MLRFLALGWLALAAAAGSAGALLVETPLHLEAAPQAAEVGDVVNLTVEARNASARQEHAGALVSVTWHGEGLAGEGDAPASAGGTVLAELRLDANAAASFAWRVPAEAQDMNVFITVEDEGETLATAHVAVGDAPPIMFATGGDAGATTGTGDGAGNAPEPAKTVPGLETLGLALAGAAAAMAVRRRG